MRIAEFQGERRSFLTPLEPHLYIPQSAFRNPH